MSKIKTSKEYSYDWWEAYQTPTDKYLISIEKSRKRKDGEHGYLNCFGGLATFGLIIAFANEIHNGNMSLVFLSMMPIIVSGVLSLVLTIRDNSYNKNLIHYALPKTYDDANPIRCVYSKNVIGVS